MQNIMGFNSLGVRVSASPNKWPGFEANKQDKNINSGGSNI